MDGTDFVKSVFKLLIIAALVALVAAVAYVVGFGSGYYIAAAITGGEAALPQPTQTLAAPQPVPTCVPPPTTGDMDNEERAMQVFWEAWKLLKEEYYGDLPDPQKMARAAIRGVVATLDDRNTAIIEPDIAKILQEDASGTFEGIGALVRINKDNILEISRLFPGQPAEKAGVKQGDRVIAVDGRSIVGLSLYEAVALIRGPAGTTVRLTIVRAGESKPFDINVVRARIVIPVVQSKMLDEGIAYVSLTDFSAQATKQLENALGAILSQKPKGLILDLRDNPGGYLQQAIEVADLFLDSGVIASEKFKDGEERTFRSGPEGIAQDIPLVVLVNGGSASASEIVAGALQDRGRAKLVGEKTFGKGSVQLVHKLSDGSEFRVTIAHWFTPNNRQINDTGLTPDLVVPLTEDDIKTGRDPQLDRAIQLLTTGK